MWRRWFRRSKSAPAALSGTALRWTTNLDVVGKRGPLWEATAVGVCIRYACDVFPQSPLRAIQAGANRFTPIPNHPLPRLLVSPNPRYAGVQLWSGTILSLLIDGNAYWRKVRDAAGRVVELWYVPHTLMKPTWPYDGSEFIEAYQYRAGGTTEMVPIRDVVHFRAGLDPDTYGRLGLSRLKCVIQEVLTDAEAAVAAHSMMRGRGIPGAIATPTKSQEEIVWSEDQMAAINYRWEQITGQGRGGMLLLNLPMEIEFPDLDVEKMAFEKIRTISTERVCAAVGLDPMVLGLPSSNKTYSNYAEARQAAFETFIVPMQRNIAATLEQQLLPEFDTGQLELAFDNRGLPVYEAYERERAERVTKLFTAGVIARRQARDLLGLDDPDPSDLYVNDVQRLDTVRAAALRDAANNARWRREMEEQSDGATTDE